MTQPFNPSILSTLLMAAAIACPARGWAAPVVTETGNGGSTALRATVTLMGKPARRLLTILLCILTLATTCCLGVPAAGQEARRVARPKLVLDCDTANEIDDLYAIVRALRQDRFEVLALNSAQWFHYLSPKNGVRASQKLNEELVKLLDCDDLPTPLGSVEAMGQPWGGDEPKDSAAARFIIQSALSMPPGDKLYVVCTGASTNLASAIKLKPEIAPRIKAYILGFQYDRKRRTWNKSEFNVRRDLNAADFLLNCEPLELHIMTATVSGALKFDRDDSFRRQAQMGKLGQYLTEKWKARFPDAKTWTMWDIVIVEAIVYPELAAEEQVITPPENRQRKVWMYHRIDAERMRADFWKAAISESTKE